jgi:hypothetical protein
MAGKKGKSAMIEYLQQEDIQQQLAGEDYRRLQASLEAFLNNPINLLQVRVELLWRFCVVIGDSYLGERWTNLTLAKYGYDLLLEMLETSGYSSKHPSQYAALTNSHSIVASDLGALESLRKLDEVTPSLPSPKCIALTNCFVGKSSICVCTSSGDNLGTQDTNSKCSR